MQKKVFLYSILLVCLFALMIGTNEFNRPDSLLELKVSKKDQNIRSKIQKALFLWENYVSNSIDSLNNLGIELLTSANEQKSDFGIAVANRILGCYDVRTGKVDRGISLLTESKNYFVSKNDNELICESMNELGIAYFLKGDLETAKSFFQSSLKFGEESPVETNCFLAQINLAKVYAEQGRISEAKFLIRDYIKQAKTHQKWESVSNAYSLLGDMALNLNQIRTAKNYFGKQLNHAKKAKSFIYVTRAMNNQAIFSFYDGDSKKSLELFQKVLERRKTEKFAFNIYDAYFNLARFHYPDKLDIALKYVDSCYRIAKKNKLIKQELEVYEWRFEHYKDKENKHLIDSMNTIIADLEKQNERLRNELEGQKHETKKDTRSPLTWMYLFFGIAISILSSRYLLTRHSALKIN